MCINDQLSTVMRSTTSRITSALRASRFRLAVHRQHRTSDGLRAGAASDEPAPALLLGFERRSDEVLLASARHPVRVAHNPSAERGGGPLGLAGAFAATRGEQLRGRPSGLFLLLESLGCRSACPADRTGMERAVVVVACFIGSSNSAGACNGATRNTRFHTNVLCRRRGGARCV